MAVRAGRRGVVVAAATPCGSVVLHTDGWPDVDGPAAHWTRGSGHAVDAARIIRSGKLPLLVLLVERKGRSVGTLISRSIDDGGSNRGGGERQGCSPDRFSGAMIDAVLEAIRRTRHDAAKPGLLRCVPLLVEAVENWDARAAPGSLVVAAATPRGAGTATTAGDWRKRLWHGAFEGGGAAPTLRSRARRATSSSAA